MRTFHFHPARNAVAALFLGGLALFLCRIWWEGGGVLTLGIALLLVAGAVTCAMNGVSSEPALRFDRERLWVRTTFGGVTEVPWKDVHAISLKVITYRYAGFIPIGRTKYLTITCEGGFFGSRRLRVSTSTMELPPGGAEGLLVLLRAAHVDAIGEAGVAMAGAGKHGWGTKPVEPVSGAEAEQDSGFDPDDAIARYLASKNAGQAASAQPAPSGGPMPIQPQRPVFGRRAS